MTKNKLYSVLLIVVFSGYSYLYYSLYHSINSKVSFCIFKNVTGYPCPSCGVTRALKLLIKEQWISSLLTNPFGVVVAIFMLLIPIWILFDLVSKKDTFYKSYKKIELILRKKPIAIILIVLVILNWIWNIKKGL